MLKKAKTKKKNKKALSEMVAYALMISIAIGLAVIIFATLKIITDSIKPATDCKEGTSVYLDSFKCESIPATPTTPDATKLTLTIKNNGGFNVDGVIVKVGNDSNSEPLVLLNNTIGTTGTLTAGTALGKYQFSLDGGIRPGDSEDVIFINGTIHVNQIRIVSIQPFVFLNGKHPGVVCTKAVIKEPIIGNGC